MLPDVISDEILLEDLLSQPTARLVDDLSRLEGDVIVLGAAGKIGPTLSRMVRRAFPADRRVTAVSRFTDPRTRAKLAAWGIETIAGDLLDRAFVEGLPAAENVIFMAGMKFGATGNLPLTWAQNAYLPALAAERYRGSRIVVYSTGNVYPFWPVESGGPAEQDPTGPVGEYAQSCLGRERIFQYFADRWGTRVLIFRLNYACEVRYGVLVDIGQAVLTGAPVDCSMGHVNVIWQGTSTADALGSLTLAGSPAEILNCAGPKHAVRDLARAFGEAFGCEPVLRGVPAETALLSNGARARELFGPDPVDTAALIRWIAHWLKEGRPVWSKPTHFQERDGAF
jgi:nucleoside-diphosphate-sugar epimerase